MQNLGVHFSILGLFLVLFANSCTESPDEYAFFNSKKWKSDMDGCLNKRKEMRLQLDSLKGVLIGKQEPWVRNRLGKPDRVELMDRHQKIYLYYLNKGAQCTTTNEQSTEGNRFIVRFTPTNQVKETLILVD